MIDTVRLHHQAALPSVDELRERGFHQTPQIGGKWFWSYNINGQIWPRLTWGTTKSGDWLTVEISIAKLRNIGNTKQIAPDEVYEALQALSNTVTKIIGRAFPIFLVLVGRVDYYYSFQVGKDNVPLYLDAIAGTSYPRLCRRITERSSVTFATETRSKEVQLYDKHDEVNFQQDKGKDVGNDLELSSGILRLEVRHRTAEAVQRLARKYKLSDRAVSSLIAPNIAFNELREAIHLLGLENPITDKDGRVDAMRAAFGDKLKCVRLLGFLALSDRYGNHFWEDRIGGYSKTKFYDDAKLIRESSIGLCGKRPLPPLQIDPRYFNLDGSRSAFAL